MVTAPSDVARLALAFRVGRLTAMTAGCLVAGSCARPAVWYVVRAEDIPLGVCAVHVAEVRRFGYRVHPAPDAAGNAAPRSPSLVTAVRPRKAPHLWEPSH